MKMQVTQERGTVDNYAPEYIVLYAKSRSYLP